MCRTLIEKSAMGRLVLLVTVSEEDIQIHHSIQSRQNFSISMKTAGHISIGHWTHMALQVGSMFLFSYSFYGYLYWKIGQDLILLIRICLDCFRELWCYCGLGYVDKVVSEEYIYIYVIKIILMYCTLKYMLLSWQCWLIFFLALQTK